MKRRRMGLLTVGLLFLGNILIAQVKQNNVVSPEVYADGMVTFRLSAPQADKVTVMGDFAQNPVAMKKDEKGDWSITVGPLGPNIYSYTFSVDDVRVVDPRNKNVKQQRPSAQSQVVVPSDKPMFYDLKGISHGSVHIHWYESRSLNDIRPLYVYTPPGYDEHPNTKYPVLYLLHGKGETEESWVGVGRAHWILDNLLADAKAVPMVVVMPLGHADESTAWISPANTAVISSKERSLEADLLNDIIPFAEKHYRVNVDRQYRAIAGLSMGGRQTLTIGLNHLDQFAWIGSFGAALKNVGEDTFKSFLADPEKASRQLNLLWMACGKQDALFEANQKFDESLSQKGIKHIFYTTEGGHTWLNWRHYFYLYAQLVFQPSKKI